MECPRCLISWAPGRAQLYPLTYHALVSPAQDSSSVCYDDEVCYLPWPSAVHPWAVLVTRPCGAQRKEISRRREKQCGRKKDNARQPQYCAAQKNSRKNQRECLANMSPHSSSIPQLTWHAEGVSSAKEMPGALEYLRLCFFRLRMPHLMHNGLGAIRWRG